MQTKSYDELLDSANEARVATEDSEAIKLYHEALAIGGLRDVEARWMLGVSLTNAEQYTEALKELSAVLKSCDESDKPNVLRDHARALSKIGQHAKAQKDITSSLQLLEASGNSSEYGATLGFGARLKVEQGDVGAALADFAKADDLLKAAENRHYELYNKLHYAEALIKNGDKTAAEHLLTEAESLIPQYGGAKHTERAAKLRQELST